MRLSFRPLNDGRDGFSGGFELPTLTETTFKRDEAEKTPIKSIHVINYHTGHVSGSTGVFVYLNENQQAMFDKICAALEKQGLYNFNDDDRILGSITFRSTNPTLIAHFIATVIQCSPEWLARKQPIAKSTGYNLDQKFTPPHWILLHKGAHYTISGELECHYTGKSNGDRLKTFHLIRYQDGRFSIQIDLKQNHTFKSIFPKFKEAFPGLTVSECLADCIFINGSQNELGKYIKVLCLIRALCGAEHFKEIMPELSAFLKLSLEQRMPKQTETKSNSVTQAKPKTGFKQFSRKAIDKVKKIPSKVGKAIDELTDNLAEAMNDLSLDLEKVADDIANMVDELGENFNALNLEVKVEPQKSLLPSYKEAMKSRLPTYTEAVAEKRANTFTHQPTQTYKSLSQYR